MMRLAVVIPTRNRPTELATVLRNLAAQTRAADSVTVVDGSDDQFRADVEAIVRSAPIPCSYLRHWPPSAAAQRNAGLTTVLGQADLVAFVDDDLTLNAEAFEVACDEISRCSPDFVGFGLNPIDEDAERGYGWLKSTPVVRWLGLYTDRIGAVTPSGWHTRLIRVDKPTEVDWLLSGAVIWKASAIDRIRFDEYFVQYSYLEDLEFSLQARSQGRFLILPTATYLHKPASGGRKSRFWFGRVEVRNRYYIVRKHHLSLWRFWLGASVRSMLSVAHGLTGSFGELNRALGNATEVVAIASKSLGRRP